VVGLVRGLLDAGDAASEQPLTEGLATVDAAIAHLAEAAPSLAEHHDLLRFAAHLTLAPRRSREAHVQALRAAGYSDREVHDVVNVVCCFSYMNRLADGLGVREPGSARGAWARQLMGDERCAAHEAWAAGDASRSDPGRRGIR